MVDSCSFGLDILIMFLLVDFLFFFFKQKTAYEMRIIDWSSDVCSSDLGNSRTFVQFAIGTPIDRAYNDVNQAVQQIRSDLPDGILEPQVVRVDIAGGPIKIGRAHV